MAEVSNKTIATLLFLAICVSLGGTLLSLNKIGQGGGTAQVSVTGAAVTGTGTGTVTIADVTAVTVYQGSVGFGSLGIPELQPKCEAYTGPIATDGTVTADCTGFTAPFADASRFAFRNEGNVKIDVGIHVSDVSVAGVSVFTTLTNAQIAPAFVCSSASCTIPKVQWKVVNRESLAGTSLLSPDYTDVIRDSDGVTLGDQNVGAADALFPDDAKDEMYLDLRLDIPDNAPPTTGGGNSLQVTFKACKDVGAGMEVACA